MAKNQFLDLLDGYEDPLGAGGEVLPLGKRFFVREISGSMTSEARRGSSARIYNFFNALSRLITYTRARVYGIAALTFGTLSFVAELLGYYFGYISEIPIATLIICGVFSIFGLLLLFSDKPIPIMLQDNPVFDFIFFDFFCIQRVHRKTGEASIYMAVAVVVGAVFALLSMFVSPIYFIAGLVALLYIVIAIGSPEFSYIVSLLLLPYYNFVPYSEHFLVFSLILTAVSFLFKVMRGKRVISFEQYDIIILLMMLVILISGIFIKGIDSFASSAELCIMSLGYFLTSNIITNRRLADRVMNTVVVSSLPTVAVGIISYIIKCVSYGGLVRPAEACLFDNTAIAATFLVVSIGFSFANAVQIHAWYKKLFYVVALVFNFAAILLTGEVFAIFAILLGGISYFAFKLKKTAASIMVPVLLILPFGIYLLPDSILSRIFEFVPSVSGYSDYTQTLWFSLVEFAENFLFGIGIGSGSFAAEMAEHGVGFANSGNLFLELALEAGILSIVFFIILLISRARHRIRYYGQFVRDSVVKHSQPVVCATVCTLVFYGMFSYIWADTSMFYLFFVVFAVESAMLRISRRARDDRILYYEDARSSESSAIDISLVGENE